MSGNYSRLKGRRAEYDLRDKLRALGYEVDRVPLSGASQGFKGDLRVRKDGREISVEAKCRAGGFDVLYKHTHAIPDVVVNMQPLRITYDFNCVFGIDADIHFLHHECDKVMKKILSLKHLLGGCDVLAVKQDRHPWIFIRYY